MTLWLIYVHCLLWLWWFQKTIAILGHGILAMDESNVACGLCLAFIGLQNTKVNHQAYTPHFASPSRSDMTLLLVEATIIGIQLGSKSQKLDMKVIIMDQGRWRCSSRVALWEEETTCGCRLLGSGTCSLPPVGCLTFWVVSRGTRCRCCSPKFLFFKCSCYIIALKVPVLLDLWIFMLQRALMTHPQVP